MNGLTTSAAVGTASVDCDVVEALVKVFVELDVDDVIGNNGFANDVAVVAVVVVVVVVDVVVGGSDVLFELRRLDVDGDVIAMTFVVDVDALDNGTPSGVDVART